MIAWRSFSCSGSIGLVAGESQSHPTTSDDGKLTPGLVSHFEAEAQFFSAV